MNCRERLFAILDGKPVDRVPIWLLFPYHQLGCYTDVRTNPCYTDIFEASKNRAVMLNRRTMGPPLFEPQVTSRKEEFRRDGWKVTRRYLEFDGKSLYSEMRTDGTRTEVKKLLETEEDLETYATYPICTDPRRIEAEMDLKLPKYLKEKEEFPGAFGSMMLALGEPIGHLYGSSQLEEYAVWSLTANDTVISILDRSMERMRAIYRYCLERNLADVYFLVGSELASPPLVSRKTFQQWIVPYAKELIKMVHDHGKKAIQHYHGQIKTILPDFLTMAPDALHTIEAPPIGNCTLAEAFKVVGDQIALIGNIQYDCFRSYSQEEMSEAVRTVLEECAGKRFILSPTAGPYEEKISADVRGNYHAFLDAGWKYGAA